MDHPLTEFVDNLRPVIADVINDVYSGTGYMRPDAGDVIAEALADARAEIRGTARGYARCNKVDDCTAQAIVLVRLADWLEGDLS